MLLFLACHGPDPVVTDDTGAPTTTPTTPPAWDAAGPDVPCAAGEAADLFEAALADAELDRDLFGYSEDEWSGAGGRILGDFELSWFQQVHNHPEELACLGRQVQSDLDAAMATPHPVASVITAWSPHVDVPLTGDPIHEELTLADALEVLTDAAGGGDDPSVAENLDPDLAEALVPIVLGLAEVVEVRLALDEAAADYYKPSDLYNGAPGWVLYGRDEAVPDTGTNATLKWFRKWLTEEDDGPKRLVDASRRLAFAVEDADLARFAGGGADWSFSTERGDLRIRPGTDDLHDYDGPVLLHLDLGGNDTYTGPYGATEDKDQAVAVAIDLGGDDTWAYEIVEHAHDSEGVLPSDAGGRVSDGLGDWLSLSNQARQGSGRYGVGLLFDLGGGADTYSSLRMSQGFGAIGVGVLMDDGGDDVYRAEAGAQGSGVFGWGFLLDGGGNDQYLVWAYGQGFAYVHSGGVLYDRAGDDVYVADPGNDYGGTTIYYSPQLAQRQGNSSLSQGAGFGMRNDGDGVYLAGGLAMLRDLDGDDDYTAGVFSQGTGYWQGTGMLADGDGNDQYDALWYIQAGAAHYAIALFLEGGGDDQYNPDFVPYNVSLGSGHDFSVAVAIDESGSDVTRSTSLGLGASNCQGIGVWADNAGDDTYIETSTYSIGLGNQSGECQSRTAWRSIGIFVDAGGLDVYEWIEGDLRTPADDSTFGWEANGTSDEHGGAVDGTGESGFHAR